MIVILILHCLKNSLLEKDYCSVFAYVYVIETTSVSTAVAGHANEHQITIVRDKTPGQLAKEIDELLHQAHDEELQKHEGVKPERMSQVNEKSGKDYLDFAGKCMHEARLVDLRVPHALD